MAAYGSETFDVYFGTDLDDPQGLIKCGHDTNVSIDPQANQKTVDTSDGSVNLINRRNKSVKVVFEKLDFAANEEEYLALQEMIEINKRIPICTITSQMRWQDNTEYIKKQTFFEGTVVPSEKWQADSDWQMTLTVNFDKQEPTQAIRL